MTDIDTALRRTSRANPLQDSQRISAEELDAVRTLVERRRSGSQAVGTGRWQRPTAIFAIAFGIAVVVLGLGGLLLTLQDSVPSSTTAPFADTTVPATTVRPTMPPASAQPTTTTAVPATTVPTVTTTAVPPSTTVPIQTAVDWLRVPDQPEFDRATISGVTVFGNRLVAVGSIIPEGAEYTDAGYLEDAAVWMSDDGLTWARVGSEDALGGRYSEMIDGVAAGPSGLIAFGWEAVGFIQADSLIWASDDGETWDLVARLDIGMVNTVRWTRQGWVAIGSDSRRGAMAWVSPDGRTWTEAEIVDPLAQEGSLTYMIDVVETDDGLVAFGTDEAGDHLYQIDGYSSCGAVWISETAQRWDRLDVPEICDAEIGIFSGASTDTGTVIGYGTSFTWTSDDPFDPTSWSAVSESVTVPMATLGEVAVTIDRWALLVSADGGNSWLDVDASDGGPFDGHYLQASDVTPFNDRFVAVGSEPSGTTPGVGVVWIGLPREG